MTRINGHQRAGLADTLNEVAQAGQEIGHQTGEFRNLLDTLNKSDFVKAMLDMRGSIRN